MLAQERYRMGSVEETPIPGNHGHTSTRHITALVTGGWDGIVADQFVEASDPDAVDEADDTAALPEQAEQVDWAPTVGWLLGLEDPGTAAGGAPQWAGRVLEDAFTRRPGTLLCAAEATASPGDGTGDGDHATGEQDADGELAATGAGTALIGVLVVAAALALPRRRAIGARCAGIRLAAMNLTVLHVDDDGFVRAPAADCYRMLTNLAAWPDWWPATRVEERAGKDHFGLRVGRWPRRLDLDLRAHGWRHERGFHLAVEGDLRGSVEFWLEPGWGGTVVHHLATLEGGSRGLHRRYRRWGRRGLWGVKDRVQQRVLETGVA